MIINNNTYAAQVRFGNEYKVKREELRKKTDKLREGGQFVNERGGVEELSDAERTAGKKKPEGKASDDKKDS